MIIIKKEPLVGIKWNNRRNYGEKMMKELYAEAGQRIKELRDLKGFSVEELALKAGITPKFLYRIEQGKQGFSPETLLKISDVLHVKCDYILRGTSDNTHDKELMAALEMFDQSQVTKLTKILKGIYEMGIH